MKFLKNKHVVTATLVAPLLALMAYFAIDFFVGEPPQAAREGQLAVLWVDPGRVGRQEDEP